MHTLMMTLEIEISVIYYLNAFIIKLNIKEMSKSILLNPVDKNETLNFISLVCNKASSSYVPCNNLVSQELLYTRGSFIISVCNTY